MFALKRWSRLWLAIVVFKMIRSIRLRRTKTTRTTIKEGQVLVISNKVISNKVISNNRAR